METVAKKKSFLKKEFVPFFVIGFWTIFTICLGALFVETLAIFNRSASSWMNDVEFYIFLSLTLFNLFGYCLYVHRFLRVRFSAPFAIIFVVLFVCNVVALYIFPSLSQGTVEAFNHKINFYYYLSFSDRLRYVFTFGVECLYFYMFFALFPKVFRRKRSLNIISYLIIFFCFVAIIFSLATEFEIYKELFREVEDVTRLHSPLSFTNNRNSFGLFILLGILACGYLHSETKRFYYFIIMGLFYFEGIFVLSKTSIIWSSFFILAYCFYRFIANLRHRFVVSFVGILIFGVIVGGVTTLCNTPVANDAKFFGNINKIFSHLFIEGKHSTLDSRIEIWEFTFKEVLNNPLRYVFGIGKGNTGWYLGVFLHNGAVEQGFSHNGFVQVLTEGGVIKLLVYFALLLYIFYLCIYNVAKKRRNVMCSLLLIITVLCHGLTESTNFLRVDTIGVVIYGLCLLPILVEADRAKNPQKSAEIDENSKKLQNERVYVERNGASMGTLCLAILAPAFVAILGILHGQNIISGYSLGLDSLYFYIIMGFLFLITPLNFFHTGFMGKIRKPMSFLSLVILGISLTLAYLLPSLIGMAAVMGVNLIYFFITLGYSLHARRIQMNYFSVTSYIPYLLLSLVLVACDCCFIIFMEQAFLTPTVLGGLIILNYIVFIFFKHYLPIDKYLNYPFFGFEYKIEKYLSVHSYKATKRHKYKDLRYKMNKRKWKRLKPQMLGE